MLNLNIIIIVCHNMQLRSFLRRIKPYPCLRANSFNYECNEVVQKIPWNGKFFSLVTDIPHSQIFAHDVEGIDLSDSSIHKQSSTNNYKHLFISLKTFVNCLDSLFWLNFLNKLYGKSVEKIFRFIIQLTSLAFQFRQMIKPLNLATFLKASEGSFPSDIFLTLAAYKGSRDEEFHRYIEC